MRCLTVTAFQNEDQKEQQKKQSLEKADERTDSRIKAMSLVELAAYMEKALNPSYICSD